MEPSFLHGTVGAWPALQSMDGQRLLFTSLNPLHRPLPRLGFGPRLIYCVGGRVGDVGRISTQRLGTVDLYDPLNASWKQLPSMAGPRSAHCCIALDGKLYAVGGYEVTSQLDTAEVYDPRTEGWQLAFGQDDHSTHCTWAGCGRWQGLRDRWI